jgi:hypothetical protein
MLRLPDMILVSMTFIMPENGLEGKRGVHSENQRQLA